MTDNINHFIGVPADALPDHYQKLLATIHVFDEAIHYTRYDAAGQIELAHQISPGDLVAALSGIPIATGPLPKECLFYSRSGGDERIGVYIPPAVRRLAIAGEKRRKFYQVPCPGLVFVGEGLSYSVYAVKQRPGLDDRLYRAPFPNVSVEDSGGICRGTAEFPQCSTTTIHDAVKAFLESNFNNHWTTGKSNADRDVLDIWKELDDAGAEEYPLDDLKATRMLFRDIAGGAR